MKYKILIAKFVHSKLLNTIYFDSNTFAARYYKPQAFGQIDDQ